MPADCMTGALAEKKLAAARRNDVRVAIMEYRFEPVYAATAPGGMK